MADLRLAGAAHNATSTGAAEAGLSGATIQGAVQGVTSSMPATPSAASPVPEAVNATSPAVPSLMDSAASAANTAGAAASAATDAVGVPVDQAFSWGSYFQALAVLVLILALLWGLVWAMQKFGKFNFMPRPGDFPRDSLRVEAQVPLGPRKGLVVVRFLNKRILLGVTDQQITFLTEAGQGDEKDGMDFQGIMEEARCQKSDS